MNMTVPQQLSGQSFLASTQPTLPTVSGPSRHACLVHPNTSDSRHQERAKVSQQHPGAHNVPTTNTIILGGWHTGLTHTTCIACTISSCCTQPAELRTAPPLFIDPIHVPGLLVHGVRQRVPGVHGPPHLPAQADADAAAELTTTRGWIIMRCMEAGSTLTAQPWAGPPHRACMRCRHGRSQSSQAARMQTWLVVGPAVGTA